MGVLGLASERVIMPFMEAANRCRGSWTKGNRNVVGGIPCGNSEVHSCLSLEA